MSIDGLSTRAATVAQVQVADLERPVLERDDDHHLARVLRVRDAERVSVIDGHGSWRICEWRDGLLSPVTDVVREVAPAPRAVAFPPLKGDRTELVVQKLTELGVDRIVLLSVERAVVQWGAKQDKAMTRLQRVAHEAAMQSRRVYLPTIEGLMSVATAIDDGFVLAHWGGRAISAATPQIAVGPEGGWSPAELALGANAGMVGLGPTILRAETAAIASGVLLTQTH